LNGKFNKRYFTIALYVFLTISACVLFYLLVQNFDSVRNAFASFFNTVKPIFYGFIIAYILNPIMNFIERLFKKQKKLKFKTKKSLRAWTLVLTYLFAFTVVAIFLLIITPNLTASVNLLVSNISVYSKNLNGLIQEIISSAQGYLENIPILSDQLENFAKAFEDITGTLVDWIKDLFPTAVGFISRISVGVSNFIVGLVVSMYMLGDKEKFIAQIKKFSLAVVKQKYVDRAIKLLRFVHVTIGSFLNGKIIDSLIIGVITFITLSLFRIPFPLLLSVIIAITNILPFFGPIIGAVTCIFLLLMIEPMQAVWFAILILIIQQVDGNIIGPKILGKTTGISALWVVVSILVGNALFGFWGMLLGVPVCAVLYALMRIDVAKRLEAKELPSDTEYYMTYMREEPKIILLDKIDEINENGTEGKKKPFIVVVFEFVKEKILWIWSKIKKFFSAISGFIKKKFGGRTDKRKKWK